LSQTYKDAVAAEDAEIAQRVEMLAEQDRENAVRREREQRELEERRARQKVRREKEAIEEAELEGVKEERRIAAVIADRMNADNKNEVFMEMCEYYDLPPFTPAIATKDWDKRFLTDIIGQLSKGKELSDRQLQFLRNIVVDEPLPATDKQKWYIEKLGGEDYVYPENINRREASELIEKLKGGQDE
jgi:hypothetical protein